MGKTKTQLLLPFPAPSLAGGGTWSLSMSVDYPSTADAELLRRLDRARRRLSCGAQVGTGKLRKLAGELETIADLFDGGSS